MDLLVANGITGVAFNSVLYPSKPSFALQFLTSRRPHIHGFVSIRTTSRGIRAMQAGKEANPLANKILEKDLSFSPSFADYVKVMEAVKVDRTNRTRLDDSGSSSKTRRSRSLGEDGDKEKSFGVRDVTGGRQVSAPRSNWEKLHSQFDKGSRRSDNSGEKRYTRDKSPAKLSIVKGRIPGSDLKQRGYGRDQESVRMSSSEDVRTRAPRDKTERTDASVAFRGEALHGKQPDSNASSSFERRRSEHIGRSSPRVISEAVGNRTHGAVKREVLEGRMSNGVSRNHRDRIWRADTTVAFRTEALNGKQSDSNASSSLAKRGPDQIGSSSGISSEAAGNGTHNAVRREVPEGRMSNASSSFEKRRSEPIGSSSGIISKAVGNGAFGAAKREVLEGRMSNGVSRSPRDKIWRADTTVAFRSEALNGKYSDSKASSSFEKRRPDRIGSSSGINSEAVGNGTYSAVRREVLEGRMSNSVSRNHRHGLSTDEGHYVSTRSSSSSSRLYRVNSGKGLDDDRRRGPDQEPALVFNSHSEKKSGFRSADLGRGVQKKNAELIEMDEEGLDDRAAFKTFEVFTDVRNRPRVLRMELEERIQHLARWLNATDVNKPEWQFSRMMHTAKIKFTDHSILRVVQILGEFGNWKRALQVVEWFRSRERFKSYKSKYIYTAVLDALGKARRPMEALNIFYAMRQEKSSYPDLAAYHCIAVTLGQAGLMKELFDVIDCMKTLPNKKFNLGLERNWNPRLEPDLVVYNAVLNACVQKKQWEGAFWVLQQLKQQGIKPSSTTYGLVMEVMFACEKYDLVHEFFQKVENNYIPSTLSYRILVNTLWKEGKIDEAVSAVHDMEKRGIVGSASLYYDLARCLCSAGRCNEALMQINKICKVAKKPLVVTYTGLIQACLNSGKIKDGEYIFMEMQKVCSPNSVTCNIMLKSYLKHGMYEEAKGLFLKLLENSHVNKKADLKGKAFPDKFTFNAMIEATSATGDWDDFEHAFTQMLHHGFHFDKNRHLRMIMDAARAGKGGLLDKVWEHLVRFARNPPVPVVKERFRMKLCEGNYASAISCLDVLSDKDANAFSIQSWLILLKFNADNLRTDMIVRLICELRNLAEEGDSLRPAFQNLLNACVKFLDLLSIGSPELHRDKSFSPVVYSDS